VAAQLGGSNPSVAARPADYVANSLQGNPANLLAVDSNKLFTSANDLYGLLCQTSDECRFFWRAG